MKPQPLVSIITINFRQAAITCDLLDTLRQLSYTNVELLLVDNGQQQDESTLFREHYPAVQIISSIENVGFAGANNLAIRHAKGEYILLLNNDTLVPSGFLEPIVDTMERHEKIGIVSPKIYYHDIPNTLQFAGEGQIDYRTGRGQDTAKGQLDQGQFEQSKTISLAHGACMLIRRRALEDIGLLSEDYFLYYEELDYCVRTRQAGWEIWYTAESYIHHRESMSVGKFSVLKTYYMFRNRWLFIQRFAPQGSYWRFVLYFLCLTMPINVLRLAIKGDWPHIRALWQGVIWNVRKGHLWRRQREIGQENTSNLGEGKTMAYDVDKSARHMPPTAGPTL